MTWKAFLGRVARLRRSIVGLVARAARRRRRAVEDAVIVDEAAPGPPAHWVERVRRGAPGLLEPSLRQRAGAAEPPAAEGVVPSPDALEPQPHSSDELEHDEPESEERRNNEPQGDVPREPAVRSRLPIAPLRRWSVRRLLRRKRSPRVVPEAAVRDSPALAQDEPAQDEPAQDEPAQDEPPQADVPRELQAEEQLVREAVDSAAETRRDHRRRVVEIEPTRVRASPDVADQRERSPRQSEVVEFESTERRSKVVEFEAPTHRRTIRTERAVPPHRRVMDDVAPLPEAEPLFAELRPPAVAEPLQSRPGAPPVPRRWPDAGPLPEPALQPPRPRPESSTRTRARTRGPDEPLVAAEIDPWPELPPRIDEPDPGVDVTLRAWERQRRLDREQTRL